MSRGNDYQIQEILNSVYDASTETLNIGTSITAEIDQNIEGDIAHDAVDEGNPIKIGGKAHSSQPTAVAANDRVNAYYDLNGRLTVRTQPEAMSGYYTYIDTSFVTGDSPQSHDVNTDLGRNAVDGTIENTGAGQFTFTIDDGGGAGQAITMDPGDLFSFEGMNIDTIAVTWVADTAYKIFVK